MKQIFPFCLISMQLLSACHSQSSLPNDNSANINSQTGFAVVELFTSQGCSSCPPADALLGKRIAAYAKAGKKLIALSFHVDYWNRLGWTDSYSQHQFTERQYAYSGKMKLSGVYTPQVVINGQWETVGSKQGTVENFIRQAFAVEAEASIIINAIKPTSNKLEVSYQYKEDAADLNIAVVQNTISTPVKAGENEGRTLTSYNVVRSWKTMPALNGNGSMEIEIPTGYNAKDYSIILYAQEKGYGKIVAANMK